ncbi:MAG: N-acetylmuramoyl-L-alanine amidase [Planctomycetes bacterium]|nr:N-acetylmuramoyl-L-alanine amidase [Planctomycetota bacterium]
MRKAPLVVSALLLAGGLAVRVDAAGRVPPFLGHSNTAPPDAAKWTQLRTVVPPGTPPPMHDPLTHSFTFELLRDLTLVPGFSQIKYGRQIVSLARPVIYYDGKLFIPKASIPRIRELLAKRPNNTQRPSSAGFDDLLVVLDAGHGGNDPGAVVNGLQEKDINLEVTMQLKAILESKKFQVKLTRSDDTFISLEGRSAIANRLNADLFISIHANSEPTGTVAGIETFYCDRDARFDPIVRGLVAAKRWKLNASKLGLAHKPDAEVTGILYGLLIEDARYRSRKLASAIQRDLTEHAAAESRGTKPGPMRVLRHVNCPAVLVETGFLTSRFESKRLADPSYQKRLARGIAKGLIAYAAAHRTPRNVRRTNTRSTPDNP